MLTQDDTPVVFEVDGERTRELEDVLHYNRKILDRLVVFEERLSLLKGRLSGPIPTAVSEGADAGADGGIMGHLQSTHQASSIHCDAIDDWLNLIESVV